MRKPGRRPSARRIGKLRRSIEERRQLADLARAVVASWFDPWHNAPDWFVRMDNHMKALWRQLHGSEPIPNRPADLVDPLDTVGPFLTKRQLDRKNAGKSRRPARRKAPA